MIEEKAKLREIYKSKRAGLTSAEIVQFSFEILNQFKVWLGSREDFTHFHLFFPIEKQNEVNTYIIKEFLEANQKKVYTSQIKSNRLEMDTFLLSPKTIFEESKMGIPIPVNADKGDPEDLQAILVPLLAFDKVGNRIGYGKGYYDVFLKGLNPKVVKIGLSYFLPEEKISSEEHDIPLDFCITPEKIFTF
ncbi:MAG: 5-formyltetrahydrofolate cyclo-ligase [Algoriphagus sp.]|nr:5-formyltetrahydrofolate cyclo-ligase [Algoriphagus sp.]